MQIGKFNLSKATNEFWNSPKRNNNLLMIAAFFVVIFIYAFVFGMAGSIVVMLFAEIEGTAGIVLFNLANVGLNLLITLPIMIWQFAFLIENLKKLFREGSDKMSDIGHVFEIDRIKQSVKPALGYLAVYYLYLTPTILIAVASSILTASWQSDFMGNFGTGYYGGLRSNPTLDFSGLGGVLILSLISILYTLLFYAFVNPAILVIGIKHGFSVALSPVKVFGFISRNINDLLAYVGVNIIVVVIFLVVAIASALLLIVCVGLLGFIALALAGTVFQLYITPALMAQVWGEKK